MLNYEQSTRDHICNQLLLRDPYETKLVEVRDSGEEEGGQGLFAARDIEAKTVVAFYNGVRVPGAEVNEELDWDDCSYRIFVNVDHDQDDDQDGLERMDIPEKFRSIKNYCATVGHKCNHSFRPNCFFSQFNHPRFGLIPCIITSVRVSAGEELLTYYKYLLSDCPEWYSNLWDRQ